MAMIDDKGKLFGKISIVDISIVCIILIGLGFGYAQYMKKQAEKAKFVKKDIQFDVELTAKNMEFVNSVKAGDEVYYNTKDKSMGKVVNVEVKSNKRVTADIEKGKFVNADVPELYDLLITIETEGSESEEKILAGEFEVKVGTSVFIKGKGYASGGYILGVRPQ